MLWAVLPAWVVARAIVLGALGVAHSRRRPHPRRAGPPCLRVHQGLLGWDAGWYQAIARHGYAPLGHQALRFFPLLPLVARALAVVPGVSDGAGAAGVRQRWRPGGHGAPVRPGAAGERGRGPGPAAVWLLSLRPAGLHAGHGVRRGPAARVQPVVLPGHPALGPGVAAGGWPGGGPPRGRLRGRPDPADRGPPGRAGGHRGGAALAGGAGRDERGQLGAGRRGPAWPARPATWAGPGAVYGDFFLPLRVQTEAGHHGGLSDPLRTLAHDARGVLHHTSARPCTCRG